MAAPYRYVQMARLLMLFVLFGLVAPAAAVAGPGDLDTSFSGDGVYAEFFTGQRSGQGSVAADIAIRPDGVSVMVGSYSDGAPGSGCYARALNAEGVPEPSFGNGGELMRRNLAGFACAHFKKIEASAGSLYLIGVSDPSDGNGERVYKLDYAGVLDTAWGDQGAYRCASRCTNLLVQEDGSVLLRDDVGRVDRLTPEGALDPSFTPVLEGDDFQTIQMQLVDDRLYLLGPAASYEDPHAVVRTVLAADGAPSGDFGGDGELRLPLETYNVALTIDHQRRIIVADSMVTGPDLDSFTTNILRRYTPDGAPDLSFGGDGEWSSAPHRSDTAGKLVIADQMDRILFTSGISKSAFDSAGDQRLGRVDVDGTLDTEFGEGGYRELRSPSASWDEFGSHAARIVETPQGAIQVGGGAIKDGACCGPEGETTNQYVQAIWQVEAGAESCVLVPEDGGELPEPSPRAASFSAQRAAAAEPRTLGRLRFGPVDAVGCFSETEPGKWVNNSPTIRINGIDFIAASGAIRLDSNSWAVSSSSAELRVGGMTFYRGPFSHDFSTARVFLDNGPLGKTFKFKGIALTGKASLDLAVPPGGNGSTKLVINAAIPGTAGFKGFSVADASVEITLQSNNEKGLLKPSVKATLGQLGLGPFGVKDGSLTYDFAENTWTADALFGLPFPVVPFVGGSATIKEGHLTAFTAKAETKIPIGASAFFLTGFNFGFSTGDDGRTLTGTGGATVAFGPPLPVPGGENGAISGATQGTYSSGAAGRPGTFKLNGELKMVNIPLSEGHITMATDLSKVDFEGRAALHGKAGPFDLFNAEGKLFGWLDPSANWQAQGNVQNVRFLKWEFPNAQALASSKGMGVCVAVANGAPRIGFGYDYKSFSAISDQCDVGKWASVRGKKSRSATLSAQNGSSGDRGREAEPGDGDLRVRRRLSAGDHRQRPETQAQDPRRRLSADQALPARAVRDRQDDLPGAERPQAGSLHRHLAAAVDCARRGGAARGRPRGAGQRRRNPAHAPLELDPGCRPDGSLRRRRRQRRAR